MRSMRKSFAMRLVFCVLLGVAAMLFLSAAAAARAEEPPFEDDVAVVQGAEAFRYAEVATEKGTLNLRADAKDNAKILDKLPRGSIVRITEDHGEWTKILYEGRSGYVMTSFLKEIHELPYSLITNEDKGEAVLAFKQALYKLGYLKSEEINTRFDSAMENALTKLQLMNGVALNPGAVTPQLQALMAWGMIAEGKSGYLDTAVDRQSGLTVSIFCWDSAGTLYEKDRAVKLMISFAAQAAGGQPPYQITVRKSLGGEQSGDVVESPFSFIWGQDSERLYIYATVVDSLGNTATACAPFRYSLPARYQDN